MQPQRTRLPWGWLALVLGCALVYLFGLGSPYAPTNGDEMVYIHIARATAESGQWLPLQSELANMRNTKPPLLFWQAMVAGDWGQHWTRFALRLPSVLYTFATAALVGFFALQLARRSTTPSAEYDTRAWRTACIAVTLFLLFFSSFRYSRAYLTSAPETFWLALPLWWVMWKVLRPMSTPDHSTDPHPARSVGVWAYLGFGVAMGLGSAYKSFALLAPAAASLWCALLCTSGALHWRTVARVTAGVGFSTLIGLGIFAMWFVLDPNPAAVWQEFVVGENAGKMSGSQGYWHAAFFGTYPMWTQLFAYPENAGLLAFAVFGFLWLVVPLAVRKTNWMSLTPAQRILLVWLLVWLFVFSLPSQRSARYVIPAMPALAICMALVWDRLAKPWFWVTLLLIAPALVILARIGWVMGDMGIADSWQIATTMLAACAGILCVAAGFHSKHWVRGATLGATLLVYGTFGAMVAPLSTPAAEFSAEVQQRMHGQRLAVPNGFTGQFERYRFLLPAAHITPYDTDGRNTGERYPDMEPTARLKRLLDEYDAVIWIQDRLTDAQPSCAPDCTVLATRWHVKSRHKSGEVTLDNLWYPQEWLFREEWLIVRNTP